MARKHVGRVRGPGAYSDGRCSVLLPHSRISVGRSCPLRLSSLGPPPLTSCKARSPTLRRFLILLSDLVELALLESETWRKKVRENQLRRWWERGTGWSSSEKRGLVPR